MGVIVCEQEMAHWTEVSEKRAVVAEIKFLVPLPEAAAIRDWARARLTPDPFGEGPFGDTTGTGVWRSMLTDEYSKSFAKSGGIGISNDVFRSLILQQANRAG